MTRPTHRATFVSRRPAPLAWVNAVGRAFERRGLQVPLDDANLIRAATRRAKLHDFGDPWFREPLGVLLAAMEDEARLSPLGRVIQRARLVDSLTNRLWGHDLLQKNPAIRDTDIGMVIVIAGLQRTGTTLLHRLLAADPDARPLLSWEALRPIPDPRARLDQRRTHARQAQRALAYLAPDFFAIHPVEYDAPEEDVLLLDQSFMSQVPESMMHVPTYASWLESRDHLRAYRELRTWLQILHWHRPGRYWILKSPHHLAHIPEILTVFPRVVVVQTHRDPCRCIPSFCSMVTHGRRIFSDAVDPHEVARHWVPTIRRMLNRSQTARTSASNTAFVDVAYHDLVSDPLAQAKRIHEIADLGWNPAKEFAMEKVLARNPRHKYGRHQYRLEDFGLTQAAIDREFADYRSRFSIARELAT